MNWSERMQLEENKIDTKHSSGLRSTDYTVLPISRKTAIPMIVDKHYLKRIPPISRAFGLYQENNLLGVITYGVSASTTLRKGVCGADNADNVYELTRLWISDDAPFNGESYLISHSIKKLDKEIIVTFAEIQQGHLGIVYQASNFIYCGLSTKFRDPRVKGLEHQHHTTYAKGMNKQQIIDKYGEENVYYVDRPRKHRYVFFNAKKRRRKQLIQQLTYPILDYPKNLDGAKECS